MVNIGGDDYDSIPIDEDTIAGDLLKEVRHAAPGDRLITLEGETVMAVFHAV